MESRFTVDGNQYAPDLHKKPTENLDTLMKALTEMLDDTSQENHKVWDNNEIDFISLFTLEDIIE